MANLFDMLGEMQSGAALTQLEQQFGLNRQQIESAMAALTPAFSEGLRRNTDDPQGFGRFIEALGRGNHVEYADNPERAFGNGGRAEGNAILGHLFKSKGLSRAVAAEASQASGLSQGILKQLLPILAPMILGGLFKQISGEKGGSNNPLGQILEQMMGGGNSHQSPRSGNNPLGKIFEEILGNQNGPKSQTQRRAPRRQSPQGGGSLSDIFGEMFSPGGQSDETYTRQMETTFDEFLGGRKN
jgi:hypothetical protein